jgi:hypothetical protein
MMMHGLANFKDSSTSQVQILDMKIMLKRALQVQAL